MRLERQLEEQRAMQVEISSKLNDLNNKFMLLHEKVKAVKHKVARRVDVPDRPPEGLAVVSLGEEEPKPRKSKARRVSKRPAKKSKPRAVGSAEIQYNRGQNLFMSGRYREARGVFLELSRSFPFHSLADNALYWLAEAYYTEQNYDKALQWFRKVGEKYPDENKAPDALLKVGYSYMEMLSNDEARRAFKKVRNRYPNSDAAVSASKALTKISGQKKEGVR